MGGSKEDRYLSKLEMRSSPMASIWTGCQDASSPLDSAAYNVDSMTFVEMTATCLVKLSLTFDFQDGHKCSCSSLASIMAATILRTRS